MEASPENAHNIPGGVGPLIEDLPLATHASVKPYIIAILLNRGAVSFGEVISCMIPHCSSIDLKLGAWDSIENCDISDKTRLELIVEEVLGEMVAQGILRYNEDKDLWVLQAGANKRHLPEIINWVSATSGQLPHHLLAELSVSV